MYNKSVVYFPLLGLFLLSCVAKSQLSQFGTLKGSIGIYEGNCMPSPGVAPCKPNPISTTIYITTPSKEYQPQLLSDSLITDRNGEFILKLAAGSYSLFIKDGNEIICDGFKCEKECICTPFEILEDSVTIINANIDHASW